MAQRNWFFVIVYCNSAGRALHTNKSPDLVFLAGQHPFYTLWAVDATSFFKCWHKIPLLLLGIEISMRCSDCCTMSSVLGLLCISLCKSPAVTGWLVAALTPFEDSDADLKTKWQLRDLLTVSSTGAAACCCCTDPQLVGHLLHKIKTDILMRMKQCGVFWNMKRISEFDLLLLNYWALGIVCGFVGCVTKMPG